MYFVWLSPLYFLFWGGGILAFGLVLEEVVIFRVKLASLMVAVSHRNGDF